MGRKNKEVDKVRDFMREEFNRKTRKRNLCMIGIHEGFLCKAMGSE